VALEPVASVADSILEKTPRQSKINRRLKINIVSAAAYMIGSSRTIIPMNINNYPSNQGFTLIELLMVISIIGITLAIAAPSFQSLIASNRLTTSANNMVSALQLAKSEAIKTNRLVIVNPVGTWAGGWLVFTDTNQNLTQDSTEPTLSTFDALNTGFTITPTTGMVTFYPDGRISADVSFYFCSPAKTNSRQLVIKSSGRIQVQTPTSYPSVCP